MGKSKDKTAKSAKWIRRMKEMWQQAQSDLCEVRHSQIHGRGVYATCDIAKDDKIIEYVGELIDKKESEKRANLQAERAAEHGEAAVYIFTVDDEYDLDGNLPWNTARLINHSCEPNCEAWIDDTRIFIHALRDIKKGEELTFDYGFDIETWEDHPCLCGRPSCVGHIVSRTQWDELAKRKAAKQKHHQSRKRKPKVK
ncbi:MAG: SET domain-containing protein [Verrucomicrobia bacterium]|jgi:SET domain-containing protein|nr:MAG: SET domain-containing protein [Verrucomicrobiota bacterium]